MTVATFTEFLRSPKSVVAKTEAGAVRITRRQGRDLVLARADDMETQDAGVKLASRIVRARLGAGSMSDGLASLFSWTGLLDCSEMERFAEAMERLVWPATELGRYGELLSEFRRWEGTAEAYADGFGPVAALGWLDEPVDVPRP